MKRFNHFFLIYRNATDVVLAVFDILISLFLWNKTEFIQIVNYLPDKSVCRLNPAFHTIYFI